MKYTHDSLADTAVSQDVPKLTIHISTPPSIRLLRRFGIPPDRRLYVKVTRRPSVIGGTMTKMTPNGAHVNKFGRADSPDVDIAKWTARRT